MKKTTNAEARREALLEARASVRADILLDWGEDAITGPILDRITQSIDQLLEKTK